MTSADSRLQICEAFLGQVSLLAKERILSDKVYREICLDLLDCVSSLLGSTSPEEWAMVGLRLEKILEFKTFVHVQKNSIEGFHHLDELFNTFSGCEHYEETEKAFEKAQDLYYEFVE